MPFFARSVAFVYADILRGGLSCFSACRGLVDA